MRFFEVREEPKERVTHCSERRQNMISTKIRNIFDYGISVLYHQKGQMSETEKSLNMLLSGYPRNHNYKIRNNNLCPSFRLYERLKIITKLYPENLESFLDIACCRGFFVMDAIRGHHCQRAAGIDVHKPFIRISGAVREHLNIENAAFYLAKLGEIADHPENYGAPFQTVLLVGAYHYLFWGSDLCPEAYHSHEHIFHKLSAVCSDRLIISGRFEANRLKEQLKGKDESDEKILAYTTEEVLKAAGLFFNIHQVGYLGTRDPLFVMQRKK